MKRLFNFTGTIVWIGLIGYGIFYLFQNLQTVAINILAVIGGFALIAVLVRLFYGKNWMLNIGKQFFIGSDLVRATENFLGDLPKPSKESTANLVGHLVYRFTRLGLVALVLAAIPVWLLFNQNQLITKQNDFIETQTKRLDQQTYLQEAGRRSSLVFLFSNVMDAIDREIKDDIGEKGVRDLSPQLIGRIIALSTRLKPYHYLEGDTLIKNPLSPERGQLLVSLIASKLDNITYSNLIKKVNLKYADLAGANLADADLAGASLAGANLEGANLRNADLEEVRLTDANLMYANLEGANLKYAYLMNANLKKANLWRATLLANLSGADLSGASLCNAQLIFNNKMRANFEDANLSEVKLCDTLKNQLLLQSFKNYYIDTTAINSLEPYILKKKKNR